MTLMMRAKAKERKRRKVAEQAWHEEQVWLEAKRAAREQAEAERIAQEAEEQRACEEEERHEAKCKHKAEAEKGNEAGIGAGSSEATGEIKRVVMDPGCTHCTRAKAVCEFLIDGNKKRDTEAGPKAATKVDRGKKWRPNEESPEPGPSKKKWVKSKSVEVLDVNEPEAGGSGARKAGMIANNLASLYDLHKTTVNNLGWITNALEVILNELYRYGMLVSLSASGSSELDSNELHEEAKWLEADAKGEEAEGEDKDMAE
ncbi:hypothetical protein M404DRAFT_32892 [Pisolithus tinctorius Marx 270]|uniref:Uncharacterized protein n=1 Tax=Pisolithus tinctorius Marx 270 TaxID=870435 RepID=A0A0C3IIP3_PISTI|nr:hypothetical protein M404DRAFT_32892 [Pisolithus tinctorius Marx 270]